MTASAEYNAIAVTHLRLCGPPSACYAIREGEQNVPVTESARISDAVNQGSSLWLALLGILNLGRKHLELDFVPQRHHVELWKTSFDG